jgi:hypothetical protein
VRPFTAPKASRVRIPKPRRQSRNARTNSGLGIGRRRGSLHYERAGSLSEVAELLGDSKRVAADHYVYALTDFREVDRSIALARL